MTLLPLLINETKIQKKLEVSSKKKVNTCVAAAIVALANMVKMIFRDFLLTRTNVD